MVQGEKSGNQSFDTSALGQMDASVKRSKFLALQKSNAASDKVKPSTTTNHQMTSSTKGNWGPFKDRNDFVNMHFS